MGVSLTRGMCRGGLLYGSGRMAVLVCFGVFLGGVRLLFGSSPEAVTVAVRKEGVYVLGFPAVTLGRLFNGTRCGNSGGYMKH